MLDPLLSARLWRNVDQRGPGECWPWTGSRTGKGYGQISVRGRSVRAHRLAYEDRHRRLKPGEVVRHRCDNPPCCNPAHLVPGTVAENTADILERGRGGGVTRANREATHCKRGHPFDEANTQRRGSWRICRACNREKQARMRRAVAAFMAAPEGARFVKVNGELEIDQ